MRIRPEFDYLFVLLASSHFERILSIQNLNRDYQSMSFLLRHLQDRKSELHEGQKPE